MIDKKAIEDIVNSQLEDNPLFLVEVKVSPQNRIRVFIDGDQGVSIDDCKKLSRHLESALDRDIEDFELEVSSVGVGAPLQQRRQFRNNTGRMLSVILNDQSVVRGRLVEVSQEEIVLEKEKPLKGKKKAREPETDAADRVAIPFEDIDRAKVEVSFR